MLEAWGVKADRAIIKERLERDLGSRVRSVKDHTEMVYNSKEVYDALHTRPELKQYQWMWRGDKP
jgi:hypothetical protein